MSVKIEEGTAVATVVEVASIDAVSIASQLATIEATQLAMKSEWERHTKQDLTQFSELKNLVGGISEDVADLDEKIDGIRDDLGALAEKLTDQRLGIVIGPDGNLRRSVPDRDRVL